MTDTVKSAIEVHNVTKSFRIPLDKNPNLKQKILHGFRGKGYREFTPLEDISFTINKGDFFGIIGRNGSGKSTLLKTIAGIYTPDKGHVKIDGLLVPFIELGVGFNPELSGRENVYLNAALLGFSRHEIEDMYEDIVDFAELHDFMEEKLRNYSSGMQVRLAFSIAIRAKGDILLLDEVLAVGDTAFQQKCFDYFAQLKQEKKTVILVSHSMSSVQKFCNKALLLEKGAIKYIGSSEETAHKYEELFSKPNHSEQASQKSTDKQKQAEEAKASVTVSLTQRDKSARDSVKAYENFTVHLTLKSKINVENGNIGINIRDDKGQIVFSTDTSRSVGDIRLEKNKNKLVEITIENLYTNGSYTIDVNIINEASETDKILLRSRSAHSFNIVGITNHAHSLFHPNFKVIIK